MMGMRLSGSSKPTVGSPSWLSDRSMTLTAAGTSAGEGALRVAVTTAGSSNDRVSQIPLRFPDQHASSRWMIEGQAWERTRGLG